MVPSQFVPMAALPLTPNGKVDQRALPDPSLAVAAVAAPVAEQPLTTPLERSLLSIWAEVLGQPQIGRDDDLLTLGADSIQLFQITARANRQDVPLLAKHLLMHRTVAKVAAALEGAAPAKRSSAPSLQQFRRDRRSAIGG
ncbi:MAG: phosphopantetheine-binding protein [Acetobacteraceae bacterium]